ncbi:MAG: histidine kinase [Polyangiales bacterium]
MTFALGELLDDTPPDRPSGPSRRDVALALTAAGLVVAEGILRSEVARRPWQIALGVAFAVALWLRAWRPLRAVGVAFGLACVDGLVMRPAAHDEGLYTQAAVLLLPYALLRWGSPREVTLGLGCVGAAWATSALALPARRVEDVVGGAVVLLFPAAVGASARFRAAAHRRDLEHARWREREDLARELHDTVAHHLAAVTLQAQAARAVMAKRPEAAREALGAIEAESRSALDEMRRLVGTLRDAPLAPQPDLQDLDALAAMTDHPRIEVTRAGDLRAVPPTVQRAVVRIAREAVTNAVRHAVGATRITVQVGRDDGAVRVTVRDDGAGAAVRAGGFGLQGMAERASLLGGTFDAGPVDDGGWRVCAVIPWEGGPR